MADSRNTGASATVFPSLVHIDGTRHSLDRAITRAAKRPPYVNKRAFIRLCGFKLSDRQAGDLAVLALPAFIDRLLVLKTDGPVKRAPS